MKSIKGTKTEKNLLTVFAGESQARNRYTYFASQAKKDGYEQISSIFAETADNEKEHAKRIFKFLEGGNIEINASFPSGIIGDTRINLKSAIDGENYEWTIMYPEFAKIAKEGGFIEIANVLENIAIAEKGHEARYKKLLENIDTGKVFKKDKPIEWKCRNCGYIFVGKEPHEECPSCAHPKAYFEIFNENY